MIVMNDIHRNSIWYGMLSTRSPAENYLCQIYIFFVYSCDKIAKHPRILTNSCCYLCKQHSYLPLSHTCCLSDYHHINTEEVISAMQLSLHTAYKKNRNIYQICSNWCKSIRCNALTWSTSKKRMWSWSNRNKRIVYCLILILWISWTRIRFNERIIISFGNWTSWW